MNKNPANFVPLTPISFLHRTADVYGHHTSKFMKTEPTLGVSQEKDALVSLQA